jgi:DNA-binding MarR family transcriptional regulator
MTSPGERSPTGRATAEARPHPLLFDDRLTAAGLMFETHAGFREVVEADLEVLGVSGSALEILLRLARSPGHRLRMSELAAQSTLTNSGLTRLVDRLQDSFLVTREPCETDGRGFFAVLTPAGLDRVDQILPSHLETVDRVLISVLEPEELAAFIRALRKIRAVVRPGSDPQVAARLAADEPVDAA